MKSVTQCLCLLIALTFLAGPAFAVNPFRGKKVKIKSFDLRKCQKRCRKKYSKIRFRARKKCFKRCKKKAAHDKRTAGSRFRKEVKRLCKQFRCKSRGAKCVKSVGYVRCKCQACDKERGGRCVSRCKRGKVCKKTTRTVKDPTREGFLSGGTFYVCKKR